MTLLLTRGEIAGLLKPSDYLGAVEAAFRSSKEGRVQSPAPLHLEAHRGGFHAKGALLFGSRNYAAVKLNGNFPDNPKRYALPTIQGAIVLCDADDGRL